MKRTIFIMFLCILLLPAHAEEATVLSKNVLEITAAPAIFGFADTAWGTDFGGVMFYNMGLALEYGVSDWLSTFVDWIPGAGVWTGDGEAGASGDILLGSKGQIIGPAAPIVREDMRLSAALAVKAPFPGGKGTAWELDNHLWVLGTQISYDYIFSSFFFLNGYVDVFYYPEQRLDNPNYGSGKVFHPLDMTFEIEPRFHIALPRGIILKTGLPLTYRVSPETQLDGRKLGNDKHRFSIGPNFSALFSGLFVPLEFGLCCDISLAGRNDTALNLFAFLVKIFPPLPERTY
jgi:hypothetical protein